MPSLPYVVLLVLATAAFVVGCGGGASSPDPSPSGDEASEPESTGSDAPVELGAPALGEKNAPVVMVEYADYQ